MSRQQLPPQITKVDIFDRKVGKHVVRYQLTDDAGENPATGKRQQVRRRYATEREARRALAEITDQAARKDFVARQAITVDQVCADYIAGRHKLRASSLSKLAYDLGPLRERHGALSASKGLRRHTSMLWSSTCLSRALTDNGPLKSNQCGKRG